MKNLIKKQEEEFDKRFNHLYIISKSHSPLLDIEKAPTITRYTEQVKNFISKVRRETAEYERERILKIITDEFYKLEETDKDFKLNQEIINTRNKIKHDILKEFK